MPTTPQKYCERHNEVLYNILHESMEFVVVALAIPMLIKQLVIISIIQVEVHPNHACNKAELKVQLVFQLVVQLVKLEQPVL